MGDKRVWWDAQLYENQFNDTLKLLDTWLWHLIGRTGAWYWDSSIPFNLANLRECRKLRYAGLSHYTMYSDRWWNCEDHLHTSYETVNMEIQMLLNFLCNKYLNVPRDCCCSQD